MGFLLRVSGIFSSLILIISGMQIASIEEEKNNQEALLNHIGTVVVGLGCFTGPLLIGIASLIDKEEEKEQKTNLISINKNSILLEDLAKSTNFLEKAAENSVTLKSKIYEGKDQNTNNITVAEFVKPFYSDIFTSKPPKL